MEKEDREYFKHGAHWYSGPDLIRQLQAEGLASTRKFGGIVYYLEDPKNDTFDVALGEDEALRKIRPGGSIAERSARYGDLTEEERKAIRRVRKAPL